jgi:undecaprenyl-diphosphatase
MGRGLLGRDPDGLRLACNVGIAFVPAAGAGLLLGSRIHRLLFGDWPVLAALAAGGLWMLWLGRRPHHGATDVAAMTWRTALGIGLFQTLALWPGTSRSMVTIGGGLLLGLEASAAAEFSFLLGLPTLGAACVHDLAGNLRAAAAAGEPSMFRQLGPMPVLLGIAVATGCAMLAVRWLVAWLTRHGLAPFGWYRLALAVVFTALLLSGTIAPASP